MQHSRTPLRTRGPSRTRGPLRTAAGLTLLLGALAFVLVATACVPLTDAPSSTPLTDAQSSTPLTAAAAPIVLPDVEFVIPPGTEAATERDEPTFQFPAVIRLQPGQSVSITNQDYAMHYFFDLPIAPGQKVRKPFPHAGVFVYQGGESCSVGQAATPSGYR